LIKDLRELQKLLVLCRKAGVKEMRIGDVSLVMGEAPPKRVRKTRGRVSEEPLTPDMPDDNVMAFYSAGGGFGEDH
jgi:hypothetical protein